MIRNVPNREIEGKELRTTNSHIKVQISSLLIFPNLLTNSKKMLSLVQLLENSIKHDLQSFFCLTKPVDDQYLPSLPPNNEFITNIKNDDKGNDIINIIKRLFLNIRYY